MNFRDDKGSVAGCWENIFPPDAGQIAGEGRKGESVRRTPKREERLCVRLLKNCRSNRGVQGMQKGQEWRVWVVV